MGWRILYLRNKIKKHKKLTILSTVTTVIGTSAVTVFASGILTQATTTPATAATASPGAVVTPAPAHVRRINPPTLTREQIADYIGWINKQIPTQVCQGYYHEPNLYYKQTYVGSENDAPIHISADQSEFQQMGQSTLTGSVVVTQPNRRIESDLAYLNRNPETQKIDSVDVYGKVVLREPGNLIIGDKGHFNLLDKSGNLNDVIYRISSEKVIEPVTSQGNPIGTDIKLDSLNAWGIADKVQRLPSGVLKVYKGTYTACPPNLSGWHLKANTLTLNKETGRGNATDASLYLGDIPLLYTPYFNFPIDDRRQTGFLYPTFGHSTVSGYDLGIPFYWNIAPNYDATITPDILTERGLQLNGVFRYLTPSSLGNFHGSFLSHDKAFSSYQNKSVSDILGSEAVPSALQLSELQRLYDASDDRYFVSLRDTRSYDAHWSSYLYANRASDDYYFEDFSNDQAQVTENQILNEGDVYYNSQHWHFKGQMQGYQTLHPVNQSPVANQYQKLPELVLDGSYPGLSHDLNFAVANQFDDFEINKNPGEKTTPVAGQRLYFNPDLFLAKYWTWGYFKPDLQLTARQYDLQNQVPGDAQNISSVLPILDLDGGLIFDRQGHWFNHPYTQTFEPRLFYLYVPYQDQNQIPLFDTSVDPFSFSQLFRTNRFTGFDRIGDANQISVAATTRFIDDATGDEKIRASIGQIYYFQKRQVNIDDSVLDLVTIDNEVPSNTYSSPIAGEVDYAIAKYWHVLGDIAWDPNFAQTNNANINFQYKIDNAHILNLGYAFLRGGDAFIPSSGDMVPTNSSKNNLNQTDFSLVWPISRSWSFIGRWNYNISHSYPQTYYGGLQYDSCCWSARAIAGRQFNYLDNNNHPNFDNRVYFQIALKTLGNVGGSDPSGMLSTDIPGYFDNFGSATHL